MSWQSGQRIVAEPTGAAVTGAPLAGGAQIHVDVAFRLVEWPWKANGPLSLVPQPSEVTARCPRSELRLGFAFPNPANVVSPPSHSSSTSVRFTLSLTTTALAVLEAARDGGSLELSMLLVAHPFAIAQYPDYEPGIDVRATTIEYKFQVPKEQWLAVLKSVGYCDTLVTELHLPSSGPSTTAQGRQRLLQAVQARNDGGYAEAMRRCRIALDELKAAGFAGKAPKDVAQFLQDKAVTMSQAERFAALRLALQLFLSPTHHANAPEEHYTREDAELAIAMTAALLRLAPQWATEPSESA